MNRRGDAETRVLVAVVRGGRYLDDLAADLDMPRMTVYGALRRLRSNGLVVWEPRHGGTLRPLVREVPLRT